MVKAAMYTSNTTKDNDLCYTIAGFFTCAGAGREVLSFSIPKVRPGQTNQQSSPIYPALWCMIKT